MTARTGGPSRHPGKQLDSLSRGNASAVLSEIRAHPWLSRSEIATNVGLSPAAITKVTLKFEQAGYVVDAEQSDPASPRGRGRPRQPIALNLDRHRFVGVHVGLQRVTAGLVDLGGHEVMQKSRKHGGAAPSTVLKIGARLVRELLDQQRVSPEDVVGYGACVGGWVWPQSGVVHEFERLGWHDVALSEGLAVDGLPVPRVESTVRALAVAEARLAAEAGTRNVLYIFVGNVIGCASVVNGIIAGGQNDAAGLIDHISSGARAVVACTCGRHDCLWAVASDAAITIAATQRGLLTEGAIIEDLVALSHTSGPKAQTARSMLAQRARRVGTAVAALIDVHDPELVIVGGGDLASSEEHFDQLVSAAHARVVGSREPTPMRRAVLVGPSGLVQGAATPALSAFYADPLAKATLWSDTR